MSRFQPLRVLRASVTRRRKRGHPVAVILMYHRIAPVGVDPWRIAVTPEHFAQHLEVIRRVAHPLSLAGLVSALGEARVQDRSLAVTFDDGYADNLHAAAPLLKSADVPATVFVTTGLTGSIEEFWWDALDRAVLLPATLPPHLHITVDSFEARWTLGQAVAGGWEPGAATGASDARRRLHYEIWRRLRPLSNTVRQAAIDYLLDWGGSPTAPRASHRVMTPEELRRLEASRVVDIGAHTVTHPFLPALAREQQREEIVQGKKDLERILGHPVSSFSYPWGSRTRSSIAEARDAGFVCATTIVEETAWSGSDPLQLPRFAVRDWGGVEFERRLVSWFDQHAAP